MESATSGNGTLCILTFTVVGKGECGLTLFNSRLLTNDQMVPRLVNHKVMHGTFSWTVLGDVEADGDVDIFDIVLIAIIYGKVKGDEGWDPRADLNDNGTIDSNDVVLLASNYGIGT